MALTGCISYSDAGLEREAFVADKDVPPPAVLMEMSSV